MKRREFLFAGGAVGLSVWFAPLARAQVDASRLLILIELKGGNDGLNTLVPYAEREYYRLRPRLGIARDQVVQLDERVGLHPSLQGLLPLWKAGELALVQGVGYPSPNLSHFRSIEIWDTASDSDDYLSEGWLARALVAQAPATSRVADGVVIGSPEMGPLAGGEGRVIALLDTQRFRQQARLASAEGSTRNPALAHILKVERDIAQASERLSVDREFKTEFPSGPWGQAVRVAAQIASTGQVAAIKLSLNGFDTHSNQLGVHARLLQDLSHGLVALRSALLEADRWNSTLLMSYAEFGRRPRENQSGGTDHGTANVHFFSGGLVRGGLYGQAPQLDRLDASGNFTFSVDFRNLYATVLERWYRMPSQDALGERFTTLDVLKS